MDYKSKIIHFSTFSERHTADNIARYLKEALTSLEIYDKIVVITCDEGSNLVAACKKLDRPVKRIWCCTHRLHLVILNGLGIWNEDKTIDASRINYPSTESTTREASTSAAIATTMTTTSDVVSMNNNEYIDKSWSNEHEPSKIFAL